MLNILILENKPTVCRDLLNKIQPNIINARVNNIAFSENEAIKILQDNVIDIIILDINCCSTSFLDVISKISNIQNSIIAFSIRDFKSSFYNSYENLFYKSVFNAYSINQIYLCLLELLKFKINKTTNLINIVSRELEKLAFNLSHIGTKYLSECIILIYPCNSENIDLQNDIYPILAKKYKTNITNIKCSIFQASKNSYLFCNKKILNEYLGFNVVKKPTTRELIDSSISHI